MHEHSITKRKSNIIKSELRLLIILLDIILDIKNILDII